MVNEIAQWVVLLFIAVFIIGLTRHLGNFLVSQRDQAADEHGPGVGARIPESVLSAGQRDAIQGLIADAPGKWGLVAVLNEMCEACDGWLAEIAQHGRPADAPLVFVTGSAGPDHLARLSELGDIVVHDQDGARLREANLRATPFLMVIDDDSRVRFQQVGGSVHAGVARWRAKRGDEVDVPRLAVATGGASDA